MIRWASRPRLARTRRLGGWGPFLLLVFGWLLLLVIAAGFLAFAGFCLVQARYRDE